MLALVVAAAVSVRAQAQSEIIVDNGSAAFSTVGTWPTSTSVPGFEGANYQSHVANGVPPSAVVVDNGDAGFSVTGTWAASTAVSGYLGVNYQHHYANGELPTAIVADNTSGTPSGTWPTSTSVAGYYGTNYQHHAAGTGTESFSWTLNVATAGSYEVYARCDLPRFFDPIVTSENGFRFREGAHEEEPFQRRTDGCDPAGGRQSASSRGRPKAQGQRADHLRLEAAFREVGTCRRETPATA